MLIDLDKLCLFDNTSIYLVRHCVEDGAIKRNILQNQTTPNLEDASLDSEYHSTLNSYVLRKRGVYCIEFTIIANLDTPAFQTHIITHCN